MSEMHRLRLAHESGPVLCYGAVLHHMRALRTHEGRVTTTGLTGHGVDLLDKRRNSSHFGVPLVPNSPASPVEFSLACFRNNTMGDIVPHEALRTHEGYDLVAFLRLSVICVFSGSIAFLRIYSTFTYRQWTGHFSSA